MKMKSFVKYNLIIAGALFIFALIFGWVLWNPEQILKKITIALPICLLLMLLLFFFSRANMEKELKSNVLKGWRTIAVSIAAPFLLVLFSIWLPEKYDRDISAVEFLLVAIMLQYVLIAIIGKKYNIDEYDNVKDFIDNNPGVEKWISKYALERLEEEV